MASTVKFDDLLRFKFLSRPLFSPDGTRAAYVLAQADLEKDGYNRNIWLCDLQHGSTRQITFSGEEKVYTWSRDGQSLYFISGRDGKKDSSALYQLPLKGGEAYRLVMIDQPVLDLWELPGGKLLLKTVYTPKEPNPENAHYAVYTQIPFWQNGKGFTGQKRTALAVWSPDGSEMKRLTPESMDVMSCVLSHDRKKALVIATDYKTVRPLANHVYELDLASGEMTCLSEGLKYGFKAAGWSDGRVIVVAGNLERYGERGNPTIYELKDRTMTCLAPDLDSSFHNSIASDCRYGVELQIGIVGDAGVTYISTQGVTSQLHLNDLCGNDRQLTEGLISTDCFDCYDGRALIVGTKGLELQELYLLESSHKGKMTQLTHHNDAMKEFSLSEPVHNSVDNGEGTQLDCWYLKPAGFEAGKKYPLILDIHGGPKGTYGAGYFHEMQCWAALGYIVLYTNPRGGDGRGSVFSDIRGHYGQGDYHDIMSVVDWAVNNLDFVDSSRMGVTGGSYGGFMTNWIISHTDRFKCAASQRGICNWISFEGVSDIGFHFGPDQQGGSSPVTDPRGAWDASPLKYVANVKTPTLFIHSAEDFRCPPEQAFQFFTALQVLGVETRLCYFAGENHELSRSGHPRNRLARLREITSWMDRFLKGQCTADDA